MQRRTLIKQLAGATGAMLLFPSCIYDNGKNSLQFKNISISSVQEKSLAELCEAIVPATDSPGAKDIAAHLFALKMVDDCYTEADRKKYIAGLKAFALKAKNRFDKAFVDFNDEEKFKFLTDMEAGDTGESELQYFYGTTKKLTVLAYTTSQYYLTNVYVYKLVPGKYNGCVSISKI